jgi:protein SDA1
MVTALQFFMGSDAPEEDSDSDGDNEHDVIKEVGMANRVHKKSRKREKQMKQVTKALKVRLEFERFIFIKY